MSAPRPLFVTGPARSGSTLLAMMLSAHPDAMVASDPFFHLFRSFRNAALRQAGEQPRISLLDDAAPLQDYYFSDAHLAALDAVVGADLDLPLDPAESIRLREPTRVRAEHASPDLVPHLAQLDGAATYRALFARGVDVVATARKAADRAWVGSKEVWTIEFCEPLARAYPQARFIVIMRDPRAIICSMLRMARTDPSQVAHALSYARHCRKHVAFIERFRADPAMRSRVLVLTYEALVLDAARAASDICAFLEIVFDPAMLDGKNYLDYTTGAVWAGNSTEGSTVGIDKSISERWRDRMDRGARQLTELVCWPDMTLLGYEPVSVDATATAETLGFLLDDDRRPVSWRSDFRDPQKDYGFELFRRALLDASGVSVDRRLIRRAFLFEGVFRKLSKQVAVTA